MTAADLGLPNVTPTSSTIETIATFFFGLVGALSVLFLAIGGFKYATSSGSPEGLKQAKGTITYAIIGLVVALFAQVIIGFVVSAV